MFNVLSALGGGGQVNPTSSNNSSTILYALFAVFSLFSGSVVNFLGPRLTLASGGIGYSLLCVSYWSYNHTVNKGFVYLAGAACGIAAAFLWSAEGAMIISLPLENDKGRYISIFYLRVILLHHGDRGDYPHRRELERYDGGERK
jgi:hypothetical protein